MKKVLFFLISCLTFFKAEAIEEVQLCNVPKETVLMQLKGIDERKWKDIERIVQEKKALVCAIPIDQSSKEWMEMVSIQFVDRSISKCSTPEDFMNEYFNLICGQGSQIKIIEKNNADIIYEIISEDCNRIYRQDLGRIFLTSEGYHLACFSKMLEMHREEKEKWIKILKEQTSIVPFIDGVNSSELSLADRLKNNVHLGENFKDWRYECALIVIDGATKMFYAPPEPSDLTDVLEFLQVTTQSKRPRLPIEKQFLAEQKFSYVLCRGNVQFQVLDKSYSQIIYAYNGQVEDGYINGIVRTFFTDQGYYSLDYKSKTQRKKMDKNELRSWKKKLLSIKVEE